MATGGGIIFERPAGVPTGRILLRGCLTEKELGIPAARGGKWSAVQVARLLEAASILSTQAPSWSGERRKKRAERLSRPARVSQPKETAEPYLGAIAAASSEIRGIRKFGHRHPHPVVSGGQSRPAHVASSRSGGWGRSHCGGGEHLWR
jgi:hypothetical protein